MFSDLFLNQCLIATRSRSACDNFDQFMKERLHLAELIASDLDNKDERGRRRNWVRPEHVIAALYFAQQKGLWK